MLVPMDSSLASENVRLHEMAHVRWTPRRITDVDGVSWPTLNAVEDCRMHKRIAERFGKTRMMEPLFDADDWQRWREGFQIARDSPGVPMPKNPLPPLEVARMLAASLRTGEYKNMSSLAREHGFGWIVDTVEDMDRRHMDRRRPPWNATVDMAREMESTFAERAADLDESDLSDAMRQIAAHPDTAEGPPVWGTLVHETPALPLRLPPAMRIRVNRATDSGAIPRNWHRLPVDGRVFTRKRNRQGGGTVLVDVSGSMSLSSEEVQEVLARWPGVTVATYSGCGGEGFLRIIGSRGNRATDDECAVSRGGNIVDGPALEWLSGMPGPRVWISDGLVTGANETLSPALVMDAARIVRAGRIQRVPNVRELLGHVDE